MFDLKRILGLSPAELSAVLSDLRDDIKAVRRAIEVEYGKVATDTASYNPALIPFVQEGTLAANAQSPKLNMQTGLGHFAVRSLINNIGKGVLTCQFEMLDQSQFKYPLQAGERLQTTWFYQAVTFTAGGSGTSYVFLAQ